MRDDSHLRVAGLRALEWFLISFAAMTLIACAGAPKGRTVLAGATAENVLVLPLNVTRPMPPELEPLGALVWSELELYLQREGRRLKTAAHSDAHNLWISSIQQVRSGKDGARADFDDAARALVLELAKHAEFDTVIIASLFIREAPISGDTVSWDGVERSLEFSRGGRAVESRSVDSAFEGIAPVASLHAVVLDAKGNKLQDATGGLELLVIVRVAGSDMQYARRKNLVENPANVREGISAALSPFFRPPRKPNAE